MEIDCGNKTNDRISSHSKRLGANTKARHASRVCGILVEFSRITEKDEKLIDDFAKAMAPSFGGHRKRALKNICELMKYYEIQAEKNA